MKTNLYNLFCFTVRRLPLDHVISHHAPAPPANPTLHRTAKVVPVAAVVVVLAVVAVVVVVVVTEAVSCLGRGGGKGSTFYFT